MTSFDRAVRDILERVSLVQVVSEFVPLKKSGRTYKGLCPFHQEKTPSFNVNEEKKLFYCFGCQTGGNAITFLTLAAGLTKREAIERLSRLAGIPLPENVPSAIEDAAARERADLMHAIAVAAEFFKNSLFGRGGEAALAYLASRGVSIDIAKAFGLGFGGRSGELIAELERRKVPLRHAEAAGLITRGRSFSDVYERFAGRLVFPVFNLDGAPIAFSARLIPPAEDGPKYVNSADSIVFEKGECLFGLHQARRAIRQAKSAILVEGNFDVLSLAAVGIWNVVAPLGTALTSRQLGLLRRFTEDVTVLFDGDDAGRKASLRAVGLMVEAQISGRVAILPDGEDPDSVARSLGAEGVRQIIDRATPMITFLVESLVRIHGRTPHGMRRTVEEAREVFRLEKDSFRYGLYREELARVLNVDVREVKQLLREPNALVERDAERTWSPLEERLLELMLLSPRFAQKWVEERYDASWITHPEAKELLGELISLVISGHPDPAIPFVEAAGGPLRAKVARILTKPEVYPEALQEYTFMETIAGLREAALLRERSEIEARLSAALAAKADKEEVDELMLRLCSIQARIKDLKRCEIRHARSLDA